MVNYAVGHGDRSVHNCLTITHGYPAKGRCNSHAQRDRLRHTTPGGSGVTIVRTAWHPIGPWWPCCRRRSHGDLRPPASRRDSSRRNQRRPAPGDCLGGKMASAQSTRKLRDFGCGQALKHVRAALFNFWVSQGSSNRQAHITIDSSINGWSLSWRKSALVLNSLPCL